MPGASELQIRVRHSTYRTPCLVATSSGVIALGSEGRCL
jgi:hypothetical protein